MLLPPPTQVVPGTFDPAPGTVATLTEKSCFSGWGCGFQFPLIKLPFLHYGLLHVHVRIHNIYICIVLSILYIYHIYCI